MEIQKLFFGIVKNKLSPTLRLADVVGEILNIGSDSAYRRIRGETELTLSELTKLCHHFNISVDSIIHYQSDNILFQYKPLDMLDMNNYYSYMENLAALFEGISNAKEKEIYFMALDIPVPHFTPFLELTFFKIYTWFQSINNFPITYEKFVESLNKDFLSKIYQTINNAYKQIPSTEIWTNNTINPLLNLMDYYFDLNCFENKENANIIVKQLLELIQNIERYTEKEVKEYKGEKAPFRLYLSPVDIMNDFMITKRDGVTVTSIKLYTINGVFTSNEFFCSEVEKWMKDTASKSLRLSGASAKERYKFFLHLKDKARFLLTKFEQ